jgi:hypothetical protein
MMGRMTEKARQAGCKVRMDRAVGRAADLSMTIKTLQASGFTTLRAIAGGLNDAKIPTARGVGRWRQAQVARVLARL